MQDQQHVNLKKPFFRVDFFTHRDPSWSTAKNNWQPIYPQVSGHKNLKQQMFQIPARLSRLWHLRISTFSFQHLKAVRSLCALSWRFLSTNSKEKSKLFKPKFYFSKNNSYQGSVMCIHQDQGTATLQGAATLWGEQHAQEEKCLRWNRGRSRSTSRNKQVCIRPLFAHGG